MRAALAVAIVLVAASPARPWGCDGHRVVALVAWSELSPRARREVTALLAAGPIAASRRGCSPASRNVLADAAMWADAVREDEPATGPWHYINLPRDAERRELRRLCAFGTCVTGALGRQLGVLRSGASTAERARALRFVIHLVGDLHQPMHATTNGDRGGNCLPVAWFEDAPRATSRGEKYDPNLHAIWDTQLVRALLRRSGGTPGTLADDLRRRRREELRRWKSAPVDLDGWAWETHGAGLAAAYGRLPVRVPLEPRGRVDSCRDAGDVGRRMLRLGVHVDDVYVEAVRPVLETQLARAGARLARVLDDTWP